VKSRDGKSYEMFDLAERELVPLPAADPRRQMASAYGEESEWFGPWSAWRHLKRATDRGIDLVQHQPPTTTTPPTAPAAMVPRK
jgi:hypothetical protein